MNDLPDTEQLILDLQKALYPASSSRQRLEPDPTQVLNAAVPLMAPKSQAHLDPFLTEIASVLGRRYSNTPPDQVELPSVQRSAAEVLAVCFVRSATQRLKIDTPHRRNGHVEEVEEAYATYLLHQAAQASADPGKLQVLLETIEGSLQQYQTLGNGFRVSVSLVAALVVLRTKTAMTSPPRQRFVWPSQGAILQRIDKALTVHGEAASDYVEGVRALIAEPDENALPVTLEGLNQHLAGFASGGDEEDVIAAWLRFRDLLGANTFPFEAATIFDPDPATRRHVLATFIYYLLAPRFKIRRASYTDQIDRCVREAIQLVPRPIPLEIHHTLLAFRARAFDPDSELESGSDVVSLDGGPPDVLSAEMKTKREEALRNLHQTWREVTKEGLIRDMRLYMLYMQGLGSFKDEAGLQKTWNELVNDEGCKRMYLEKVGNSKSFGRGRISADLIPANASWPPTPALNHMLSALFLIPKRGASIALELFNQASSPDSSVPCNLITINILLRHYARAADVPAMNSLFVLAEKLKLKPDVVTYTTLVQGLLRAGQLEMAKNALDTMYSEGLEPSERMCSMLIADLAKDGDKTGLSHAEELLREMQKKGFRPDVITWTGLISGYFRGGWEEDGWHAVDRMERLHGIQLTRTAYNVVLRQAGLGKIAPGTMPVTPKLFKRMQQDGVIPNSDTYVIMLEPLIRAKLWAEAQGVLAVMRQQGFQPEKGHLIGLMKRTRLHRTF